MTSNKASNLSDETLMRTLETLCQLLRETQQTVHSFKEQLVIAQREQQQLTGERGFMMYNRDWIVLTIILVFQAIVQWIFK